MVRLIDDAIQRGKRLAPHLASNVAKADGAEVNKKIRAATGLLTKAKILVGLYQIISSLESNLPDIAWPDSLSELSRHLSFLNVDLFSLFELDCLQLRVNFYHRFVAFTFGPLFVIFIAVPIFIAGWPRLRHWWNKKKPLAKLRKDAFTARHLSQNEMLVCDPLHALCEDANV